jgi:hypothetical protein
LIGLAGIWPSSARAEECRLHVDAGALSAPMIALLASEVPSCEIVTSSGTATLSLAIMRADGHLDVDMTARDATPVLARRVAIDDGDPEPALRRIALLAARAVESSQELEPFEPSVEVERAPEAESSWHLSIEGSFATSWWAAPNIPRFGPALALSFAFGAFDVGLFGAWFVAGEGARDHVEFRATEIEILGRGGWRPLAWGPLSFGLELGAGANVMFLRARSIEFSADTVFTETTEVEGLIRGGGIVDAWLWSERLHAFVRGGGLVRIPHVEIPIAPGYEGRPVSSGTVSPWLEVGLAVRFF